MHWTLPDLLLLPVEYYTELVAILEEEAKKHDT
jgi:hypothetical protein